MSAMFWDEGQSLVGSRQALSVAGVKRNPWNLGGNLQKSGQGGKPKINENDYDTFDCYESPRRVLKKSLTSGEDCLFNYLIVYSYS